MTELKRQYQCCYCGKVIRQSAVDPCAVVIVGNWCAAEAEQAVQQFFCHVVCFRKAVKSDRDVVVEELVASNRERARE